MMKSCRIFSRSATVFLALASSLAIQPAIAIPVGPPGPPAASATIRTLDRSVMTDWTGHGDIAIGTNLCITSTTGSYRLTLTMPGLFHNMPADARIIIRLTDATGVVQERELSGGTTVQFVGSTIGRGNADCANEKYALLQALIAQDVLTAQQAGDYMSQISLSVAPA